MERQNARTLTPQQLPEDARRFDLITIDVSFISLRQILPVLPPLLQPGGDVVALVKPQFEAGREEVGKGGIVRDEGVHKRVVDEVTAAAAGPGTAAHGRRGVSDHRDGRQPRVPAPSAPAVTAAISRVGLVAKQRVEAAAGVLLELAAWLEARGIRPVFDDRDRAPRGRRRPVGGDVEGGSAEGLRTDRAARRRRHPDRHGPAHRPRRRRRADRRRELRQPRLPDGNHPRRALSVARGGPRRHRADRGSHDAARANAARRQHLHRRDRAERRGDHEGGAVAHHRARGLHRRRRSDARARRRPDRGHARPGRRPTTSPPAGRSCSRWSTPSC